MEKRVAVILLVLALILVMTTIVYSTIQTENKISTINSESIGDDGAGKIGVIILPPEVEDKNAAG